MATFTLTWTPVITGNVTAQRASFRQKSVGGAFLTTGFSPANDLSTAATTTSHGSLTDNTIYEFKISNVCTTGGPTDNSNGVIEQIVFACISPSTCQTTTTATASYTGLPSDITKVRFSLLNFDGSSLLQGPIVVNTSAGSCSNIFSGLTPDTAYIIRVEFVALINGVEVTSTLNTCQVSVTTNLPGDMFLINGSDSMLINGSDTLTI